MQLHATDTRKQLWHDGSQFDFLTCNADIAILSGGGGTGKTYAMLLDPLRYVARKVPGLSATFFRRTIKELTVPGGLWHTSADLYQRFGGEPVQTPSRMWTWRNAKNAPLFRIFMAGVELEKDVHKWQGAQMPIIYLDELTSFTEYQFWYLFSRNRTNHRGIRPYLRAATNPDADSWVAHLIDWWVGEDGYIIPERSGVHRYFIRVNDTLIWADSPDDLPERYNSVTGDRVKPKSLTVIDSKLEENVSLMETNPEYEDTLMSLNTVERERLRWGNWKIRPSAGDYFNRKWIEVVEVDAVPANLTIARGWDLAATEEKPNTDPDWTCGTKIGHTPDKTYYVLNHIYERMTPGNVEKLLKNTATQDGYRVTIGLPQDPGQAGVSQRVTLAKLLTGFDVRFRPVTGDKLERFKGFSAQAQAGNVKVLRGSWNERWFRELENFPPIFGHDDDADSTSEAFNTLIRQPEPPTVGHYSMR